jgi:acyl-CoA synthetase
MWELREPAPALADAYRRAGWWNDDSLGRLVERGMRGAPRVPVRIWSATRPWRGTLGDVLDLSARLAGGLRGLGVAPGDVVAVQLPNWVEGAATWFASSLLGAVVVPIVHYYGTSELSYILRESRARVLVTADRFGAVDYLANLETVRPYLGALEHVVVVGDSAPSDARRFGDLLDRDRVDTPVVVDPASPALVAYTSGTSANPKGVIQTQRSLGAEVRAHLPELIPAGGRPVLLGAPISHATGMLLGLLLPASRGESIQLIDAWDPTTVLDAMLSDDLSAGSGATVFLTSLLDHPAFTDEHLARMASVVLGGSSVPTAVAAGAEARGIAAIRSYGLTEMPTVTGAAPGDPGALRTSTDGRGLPGVEIRLVADDGTDAAAGEPGEIVTRGPDLFAGYTDRALTDDHLDPDGWFATGDVGTLADGWLTITDRKKDVIIRNGVNVSPAEVENALMQLPEVAEVAVVGRPDARTGERAVAMVRVREGAAPPDLVAVRAHLAAVGLGRPKWPEEVVVVDDFPRTAAGKVKKFALRDELRAEPRRGG